MIPRYVRVGAIIVEEKVSTLESLVVNRPPEGGLSEGVAVVDDGQVWSGKKYCKAITGGSTSSHLQETKCPTCPAIVVHQRVDAARAKADKDPFFNILT